ncbi:MAG TPA: hemerythrin domain-containing protein [Acidimicrobiales bacterium]|nr:hemerythrin domain-containing protein [Acidimicrobiales bacterium]
MTLTTYVIRHNHRRLAELMRHIGAIRHDLSSGMHPGVLSVAVSTAETFSQEVFRHMAREERELYPLLDPEAARMLTGEHIEIQRLVTRVADRGTAQNVVKLLDDLDELDLRVQAHLSHEEAALDSLEAPVANSA